MNIKSNFKRRQMNNKSCEINVTSENYATINDGIDDRTNTVASLRCIDLSDNVLGAELKEKLKPYKAATFEGKEYCPESDDDMNSLIKELHKKKKELQWK